MSEGPRVVVVLGMHRSGTSALAAGLAATGVELGGDLLPGGRDENPKGFFEDEWILDFSERLLAELGCRWDSTLLLERGWWKATVLDPLRLEAARNLRERFGDVSCWGFKNPRTARLLPFWQDVFERIGHRDSYLIAVRDPLSVAASLRARNSFAVPKSHLLWLLHTTEAVLYTEKRHRVFSSYDDLLSDPAGTLERISNQLGLPFQGGSRLDDFTSRILDPSLRHSVASDEDLALDRDCFELARESSALLRRLARDDVAEDDERVQRHFRRLHRALRQWEPAFRHLDHIDRELSSSRASLEDTNREVTHLREEVESERVARAQADAGLSEIRQGLERERLEHDAALASERAALQSLQIELARVEAENRAREDGFRDLSDALRAKEVELSGERAARLAAQEELGRVYEVAAAGRERSEALVADRTRLLIEHASHLTAFSTEAAALRQALASAQEQREAERAVRLQVERRVAELASLPEVLATVRADHAAQEDLRLGAERRREALAAQLDALRAAERHRLLAWCAELAGMVSATGSTRTWRAARRFQRLLDVSRRRPSGDAIAALGGHVAELSQILSNSSEGPAVLAQRLDLLRHHFRDLKRAETFRITRWLVGLSRSLTLRGPETGPLERIGEILDRVGWSPADTVPSRAADWSQPHGNRDRPPGSCSQRPGSDVVDVVVPVHSDWEVTRRCLESVLGSDNRTRFELVVVDDSGGEGTISERLGEFAVETGFTLLVNPQNLGFVAAANRGMQLHEDRDVVLLNSDAVVHGDWLDRLRTAAYSDWMIASATPWSNSAEICSYPIPCVENPVPTGEELRLLDERCRATLEGRTVTIPTCVGFCTYLRRECLRDVGLFDVHVFGRGYGEENDLSMRARDRGWRHVLAADVYVAHVGGVSFGPSKQARIAENLLKLDTMHPRYLPEVATFVREDPPRRLRRKLDLQALPSVEQPSVLFVTHGLGGGTDRHVRDLAGRLAHERTRAFLLQPGARDGLFVLQPAGPRNESFPNLSYGLPSEYADLRADLRSLDVRHIHFHHLIGIAREVENLPADLDVPYDFTIHDYFPICPRVHLIGRSGSYCGEPEQPGVCARCVRELGSPVGDSVDIAEWRDRWHGMLRGARRVFVPSEDTMKRLARYFPSLPFAVREHEESVVIGVPPAPRRAGDILRVAVVGAIGEHKGVRVLEECLRDADTRGLPIEFHLVGFSDRDEDLSRSSRVRITGRYREEDALDLIASSGCHVALIPSVWPETYCYVLSAVFAARLHPIAFDIGAVADRIRDLQWGTLLPLGASASTINDRLLSVEPAEFPEDRYRMSCRRYPSLLTEYYGLDLG